MLYTKILDDHPDPDRPRIAFCHGLFGQGKNWTTIGRQLAADYRVALIDMPDHGRSPWTDELSYPSMAAMLADDLDASDSPSTSSGIGGTSWTLVGHSMGGKIAMTLALTRPELVERLVVVDIAPVDYGDHADSSQGEFAQYVDALRSVDLGTLTSRQDADDQLIGGIPDPTVRSFLLQNLRRNLQGTKPGWHWQMNLGLLGDQHDVLSGFPELDTAPYPGPTLWVAGAESDYILGEYADTMKRLFPQVRSVKIKNARHWVHSEQPEIFLGVLRNFLTSTDPKPVRDS